MIHLGEAVKCDYCGKNVPVSFAASPDGGETVGHRLCVLAHRMGVFDAEYENEDYEAQE